MLSGQGADEYLAGYRRYLAEKLYQKNAKKYFKNTVFNKRYFTSLNTRKFNGNYRRFKKIYRYRFIERNRQIIESIF